MRILYLCEECDALHKDPDGANKCKHTLHEEIDLEAQSVVSRFIGLNSNRTLMSLDGALATAMQAFAIFILKKARK